MTFLLDFTGSLVYAKTELELLQGGQTEPPTTHLLAV